jgi:CubicO group peptidase (beta-lactamase class C family)
MAAPGAAQGDAPIYDQPPTMRIAEPPLTPDQKLRSERFAQLANAAGDKMKGARFSGEIAMAFSMRDDSKFFTSTAMAQDADGNRRRTGLPWRWASVTKQVIAVMIMQEVARGTVALDAPVARYLPGFRSPNAGRITVRQLLRHQTGLPNPDDTPADAQGVPSFYTSGFAGSKDPLTGYCAGPIKGEPGAAWSYNNCDYMVAGALLEAVTGQSWQSLLDQRKRRRFSEIDSVAPRDPLIGIGALASAVPVPESWPGYVAGKPEPALDISSFGAAGALYGTTFDLVAFDILLANGLLLPPEARDELWDGLPELGYMALGQWSFEAPLKGCDAPVRIIERRGGIGGIEVRNFILPESHMAIAMFTDRDEFEFGDVWQAAGFSYEMLSLAACPQEPS